MKKTIAIIILLALTIALAVGCVRHDAGGSIGGDTNEITSPTTDDGTTDSEGAQTTDEDAENNGDNGNADDGGSTDDESDDNTGDGGNTDDGGDDDNTGDDASDTTESGWTGIY